MSANSLKPNSPAHWYAVVTRSRHEKVVAELLWQKEVECFLPLHENLSRWKDRYKKVQFPLFPGYLFVHVPIKERRLDILKVSSVVRIVGFEGKPTSIPKTQVDAIKRLVFSTLPYDPCPFIKAGDGMEIIRGPLRGLRGTLLEKKGIYRFIVSIDLIQQAISCEINACDVVKIR